MQVHPEIARTVESLTAALQQFCPAGLEYLLSLNELHVILHRDCCDGRLKFDVKDSQLETIVRLKQQFDCCSQKEYSILVDHFANGQIYQNAIFGRKELPCCITTCNDKGLRVESPHGVVAGYVVFGPDHDCDCCSCGKCGCETCGKCGCDTCGKCGCETCCECKPCCLCLCGFFCCMKTSGPILYIMDMDRNIVMSINDELNICCGKLINCDCCTRSDQMFSLRANNGESLGTGDIIGQVTKKYPGCICKDPDHYVINFPLDLDVKMKVVIVCAIFVMKMLGR